MKNLLIVYHTQTGNTGRMAQAVWSGAKEESDTVTRLKIAACAGLKDLIWADALLLGTPENFGYMSGAMKNFFDRTYYPAQPLQLNLPYAIFVSAGNDGSGAVREIDRIALGYPLKKVAEPVIAQGELGERHLELCRELGLSMASGLALGIF